jgi:cytosine/adenosine deaminase-related metal-dependent hydrolase
MIGGGIAGCADFREGGPDGVNALNEAAAGLSFQAVIFGRDGGEKTAEGLGISSVRDVPDVERQVADARKLGKKIAFHAGERDSGDVDAALAFDPDILIHATHATKHQLRQCVDRNIPIVICPRSNWILNVTASSQNPPVQSMLDLGCSILLGTDNVMFVPPDMLSEMAFVQTVYHLDSSVLLKAAIQGADLSGNSYYIREGARTNFFCIDFSNSALSFSRNPLTSIIKRAYPGMIGKNVFNLKNQ